MLHELLVLGVLVVRAIGHYNAIDAVNNAVESLLRNKLRQIPGVSILLWHFQASDLPVKKLN
jgi:hypothetical protein